MELHPYSRSVFFQLPVLGVLKKHLGEVQINIDLSNNTNPFLGEMAEYPDLQQKVLKEHYWHLISSTAAGLSWQLSSPSSHILFTVGSSEGIDLLIRAFAEPNQDTIVVTDPSFPAYEHWGRLNNLHIKKVALQGEQYDQLDIEEVISANPKLVFLCYPNNPTGTLLNAQTILELCQRLKEGFIVIDEAYIEFADAPSFISALETFNNLIILRTFSKAWGLAGVRCGAVIASDPRVIHTLRCLQVPFGLATPSQEIIAQRCKNPEAMIASWGKLKKERDKMLQGLRPLKSVKRIPESKANFLLVQLNDYDHVMTTLQHHRVYVMDCSKAIPNSIRVTIGNEGQNQKFMEIMGSLS